MPDVTDIIIAGFLRCRQKIAVLENMLATRNYPPYLVEQIRTRIDQANEDLRRYREEIGTLGIDPDVARPIADRLPPIKTTTTENSLEWDISRHAWELLDIGNRLSN